MSMACMTGSLDLVETNFRIKTRRMRGGGGGAPSDVLPLLLIIVMLCSHDRPQNPIC